MKFWSNMIPMIDEIEDDGDDENILEIRIEILWWVKFGITKAGILILLFWSTT